MRTIRLQPYTFLLNPTPPIVVFGHVVIRTFGATSTDGLIGGISSVREIPFHLDRNVPEATEGTTIEVNLRLDIPNKRLEARWRISGGQWSTWSDVVSW